MNIQNVRVLFVVFGAVVLFLTLPRQVGAQERRLTGELMVYIDGNPSNPSIAIEAVTDVHGSRSLWYPLVNGWNSYSEQGSSHAWQHIDREGVNGDTIGYAKYKVTCMGNWFVYIDFRDADFETEQYRAADFDVHFDNTTHTWDYRLDGDIHALNDHAEIGIWQVYGKEAAPRVPVTVRTDFQGGEVTVDQVSHFSPFQVLWGIDSTHSISVSSPQGSHFFTTWSDGGYQSHGVPPELDDFGTTFTSNFVSFSASVSGDTYLEENEAGYWTVTASGGTSPYHYQWYYFRRCPDEK